MQDYGKFSLLSLVKDGSMFCQPFRAPSALSRQVSIATANPGAKIALEGSDWKKKFENNRNAICIMQGNFL
jgi:hypothetical protein